MILQTCCACSFICEILKRRTTTFYLAVNLFLLAMHSSVSLCSNLSCP